MYMPEHIDYDGLKDFLEEIFGLGPEEYSLLPPRDDKIPVNGLIVFDKEKRPILKYPPKRPVIYEELRNVINAWVIEHEDDYPHLMQRLEKLCGIL